MSEDKPFEDKSYPLAQTAQDYMAVYQATVLTWDILRLHEMKIGVLRSHQRPALESLLRRTNAVAALKGAEPREADQKAAKRFADPATRPAMMNAFELAGYPPNAVQTEVFMRALPSLAQIDRLIVSAQKRLDVFLKDLEKTCKGQRRGTALGGRTGGCCQGFRPNAGRQKIVSWRRNGRWPQTSATPRKAAARKLNKAKRVRG